MAEHPIRPGHRARGAQRGPTDLRPFQDPPEIGQSTALSLSELYTALGTRMARALLERLPRLAWNREQSRRARNRGYNLRFRVLGNLLLTVAADLRRDNRLISHRVFGRNAIELRVVPASRSAEVVITRSTRDRPLKSLTPQPVPSRNIHVRTSSSISSRQSPRDSRVRAPMKTPLGSATPCLSCVSQCYFTNPTLRRGPAQCLSRPGVASIVRRICGRNDLESAAIASCAMRSTSIRTNARMASTAVAMVIPNWRARVDALLGHTLAIGTNDRFRKRRPDSTMPMTSGHPTRPFRVTSASARRLGWSIAASAKAPTSRRRCPS